MGKVYLLGDSKGIPFAAFTSLKAVFQYVDVNWYTMMGVIQEERTERAALTWYADDIDKWPTATAMAADRRPYHFEGSSMIQTELGTVTKRFRGQPAVKLSIQDSTGTLVWTLSMFTTIAAKR